ncbi:hypothetical protein SEA_SURVIVORS_8 [Gordonia phage Survivors]|nr:hypothetical protein SEA_SURVIVORS_8 [Gordonia phage Survivors]
MTVTVKGTEVLTRLWQAGAGRPNGGFLDYMLDGYPDLADPLMDMAQELGIEYYNLAGRTDAGVAGPLPPRDALQSNVINAVTKGNATTGLSMLSGSLQRQVFSSARRTVEASAENEPGALWARRARPEACGWCKMLATREDVYSSAESALKHGGSGQHNDDRYHDECHCLAVAVRPGRMYSPPSYARRWEEEYIKITREVGTDPNAVAMAWDQLAS